MKTLLCVALLGSLTGCLPFHTTQNGAPPPFSRVLVVSRLTRITPTYLPAWSRAFPGQYSVCAVDAGPMSFGNPDSTIQQQAQQCRSEVVLTISVLQNNQGRSGRYSYDLNDVLLEMATLPDRRAFWKGVLSTQATSRNAVDPFRVVSQLKRDGVITGTLPASYAPTN